MRVKLFLSILICGSSLLHARSNYTASDSIALQLPAKESRTVEGIAGYINRSFTSPDEKTRAIYIWLTHNISYDVENMYKVDLYQSKDDIVQRALKTHKGICMSYTELFNAIAAKTGLTSYSVPGYTKQNGKVDALPHIWNAVQIGTRWYLIDATWGTGYLQNGKFIHRIDEQYFKADPRQFIRSHNPFDPLWQMLGYTVTNQDFYNGDTDGGNKERFQYRDSLAVFQTSTEEGQLVATARRIEANGVLNSLIYDELTHIRKNLEIMRHNNVANQFNDAVNHFNKGIALINRFVHYRNAQFTPEKPDKEIKQLLDSAMIELVTSSKKLKAIKHPNAQVASTIKKLNKSIGEAFVDLQEQNEFLDKYFRTDKPLRKSLFYKYTMVEIPAHS